LRAGGNINGSNLKKSLMSIYIIFILIIAGFIGIIIFPTKNATANPSQDLNVNNVYTVSGTETWRNITIKDSGKLIVPTGTSLNACNIFLENGSIVEIR